MTDLLHRLENEEPSRELDAEIAVATGWQFHGQLNFWMAPERWPKSPYPALEGLPHFTTDMNAAMALVPEGMGYVEMKRFSDGWYVQIAPKSTSAPTPFKGSQKPAAQAITIAAYKAIKERGNG